MGKKVDLSESLNKAAPNGVDCYFDNVGGEMTATIISKMNVRGRVAVCGAISHYNEKGGYSKVTDILPLMIGKEIKVEGFETMPEAFMGLITGANTGKMIV